MAQEASRNFLVYIIYDCILNVYSFTSILWSSRLRILPQCSACRSLLPCSFTLSIPWHDQILVVVVLTARRSVNPRSEQISEDTDVPTPHTLNNDCTILPTDPTSPKKIRGLSVRDLVARLESATRKWKESTTTFPFTTFSCRQEEPHYYFFCFGFSEECSYHGASSFIPVQCPLSSPTDDLQSTANIKIFLQFQLQASRDSSQPSRYARFLLRHLFVVDCIFRRSTDKDISAHSLLMVVHI